MNLRIIFIKNKLNSKLIKRYIYIQKIQKLLHFGSVFHPKNGPSRLINLINMIKSLTEMIKIRNSRACVRVRSTRAWKKRTIWSNRRFLEACTPQDESSWEARGCSHRQCADPSPNATPFRSPTHREEEEWSRAIQRNSSSLHHAESVRNHEIAESFPWRLARESEGLGFWGAIFNFPIVVAEREITSRQGGGPRGAD